ncbi:glycoside hydrolase domain-containing protein [Pseudosporangium ferrugineum]|uniref:VCBS repeat protein n=1 Tax=Pseudosporangium ferrugineum TaxID=439699 RepID=A0A2T0SHT3_9ACTN|nr:glycoside hydrolase domain-containing protein [Pseudosporangium ferrugineum]PRY32972.1 VCBS repeat protein [Pseudosporangium ferrugineum]
MDRRSGLLRTLAAALIAAPLLIAAPAAAAVPPQPGTYTGYGFDACAAPSAATMTAWLESPYRAAGIYFGGDNRGCTQANLTADWVAAQQAAGWHLIPLYVGPQASCTTSTKKILIDDTRAAAQGRAAAEDAAARAAALGLAEDSVLIYDMEAYRTDDATCRAGVLAFMSAWTARLHDLRYLSGFYSSMSSGVADQVAAYPTAGYVRPDLLDFARWDQVATVTDPAIPAGYWPSHRRIKQYRGGHDETWGGVTINIDNDYLDVAPSPRTPFADFTGNGWADVLARTTSGGELWIYPGNGGAIDTAARLRVGAGWEAMNAIVRIGDLDRDGREDVVARQSSNGDLWFYPGTGTALAARKRIATGWGGLREITGIGDFDRDGYPDLLAVQTSNNNLYLYPGRAGAVLGPRVLVGSGGWNTMSELAGVGDFDRDGYRDMVARLTSSGALYFYAGRSGGFAARRQLGTGWGALRDLTGVGDFDRDGYLDLAAVQTSSGQLLLYRGNGSTIAAGVRIATGFGAVTPVL